MEDLINNFIVPHWGFLVVSAVFALAGQVSKGTLWTKDNIVKYKTNGPKWLGELMWWGRKTMPMHPVVGGLICGLIPGMPAPDDFSVTETVMYYVGAGVSSTWIFSVIKQLAKKKGIELDLPGVSQVPPAPPPVGQA